MGAGVYYEIKTDEYGIIIVWDACFSSCFNISDIFLMLCKWFVDNCVEIVKPSSNDD